MGLGLAFVAPAGASDDLAKYQGEEKKGVVVTSQRTYENNQTAFTFTLALKEGENQVSHAPHLLPRHPDRERQRPQPERANRRGADRAFQ